MNTLKRFQTVALAAAVGLALAGMARAHDPREGGDRQNFAYHNGYRDGFDHGNADRARGAGYSMRSDDFEDADRGYDEDMGSRRDYRENYRAGYTAGYDDGFYSRGQRYRNDEDDRGAGGGYGHYQNAASSVGYQDGLLAGKSDSSRGKKFRPEKNDRYEDANHGYSKEYGNKNLYKQEYRQAFTEGYQDGYNGPGR